jgi:DNA-binding NtrC family response regulator
MRTGVLFVSPHTEDADRLTQILDPLTVRLEHVPDLKQARAELRREPFPVILTDADLPDGAWADVLDLVQEVYPAAKVIVTDRFADGRLWVEALSRGVFDILAQPFYATEVRRILTNAYACCAHGFAG